MRSPVVILASVALLAAGCGGAVGGSTTSQSPTAAPLAFSRCMRAHGVPKFPDPDSSGVWPKPQVAAAAAGTRFQGATRACGHLLPDGGPGVAPSPAVTQQIQEDMTKFARCMRAGGVASWPAATLDRGRAVFDPQAVGIDTSSPRVSAAIHACERVFPPSIGIPPGA